MHLQIDIESSCLTLVLPFADTGVGDLVERWAQEEAEIDFDRDPDRANRCTMSFAATELQSHLSRGVTGLRVRYASQRPEAGSFIELRLRDDGGCAGGFSIEPDGSRGIVITGADRAGVLYGAYELLREMGWRWVVPGAGGTAGPPIADTLRWPRRRVAHAPSMSLGRGFDFTYESMESAEFLLWMARNRLNLAGCRPRTAALARKLCIELKAGGHLLESILDPNRVMPNGRRLFDERPEWYGTPASGPKIREKATLVQPCFSQPTLRQFICEQVIERLRGEWRDADRLDVWGFDCWGSICACPACSESGNGSDQMLVMFAVLRDAIDHARVDGRLARNVRLVLCAYEGTLTLQAPTRPLPANVVASGDYVVFYPINRCYAHDLDDPSCETNAPYQVALRGWLSLVPAMPVMIGEYYNVSRFEDLPLLFTDRLIHDLPVYRAMGVRGITYMHVPMVNWSVRALTQNLYAQLAWDADAEATETIDRYFEDRYGPFAGEMETAYDEIERAWRYCASWRAWSLRSILANLLLWDGQTPAAPLAGDAHFPNAATALRSGRESIRQLERAAAKIDHVRSLLRERASETSTSVSTAVRVNPLQTPASREDPHLQYELSIGQDRRAVRYGLDVMRLMTEMVAYHDALYQADDAVASRAWHSVEQAAESLDNYYVPIDYEWPGPGLQCKDGLTRSQLRDLVSRCRRQRISLSVSSRPVCRTQIFPRAEGIPIP